MDEIISELRAALKKDDQELRREVERIVRKYGKKKHLKGSFEIKAGNAYYINEKKPIYARKIFVQVLARDIPGLYITRENPDNLGFYGIPNSQVVWLTTTKGENKISPGDLTKIQAAVVEFMKSNERGVVVLEGIETMITNTNFIRVLHLVERLRDVISEKKGILIITLDMDTLDTQEQALLKKEVINEITVKRVI